MANPIFRLVHELFVNLLRATGQWLDRLRRGAPSAGVSAGAFSSWTPLFGGLSIALAFGGWRVEAADPKLAPAKTTETSRATTTFEKPPFWWGSEALRHNGWILDSDLSADGKRLATASWDSFAIWELSSGKKLLHIQESESVTSSSSP